MLLVSPTNGLHVCRSAALNGATFPPNISIWIAMRSESKTILFFSPPASRGLVRGFSTCGSYLLGRYTTYQYLGGKQTKPYERRSRYRRWLLYCILSYPPRRQDSRNPIYYSRYRAYLVPRRSNKLTAYDASTLRPCHNAFEVAAFTVSRQYQGVQNTRYIVQRSLHQEPGNTW